MEPEQRVLMVAPSFVPYLGGAQRFQHAMASRLIHDGHKVTVLTSDARRPADFWQPPSSSETPLPQHDLVDGIRIERLHLRHPWPAPYAFGIQRRLGHLLGRSPLPGALQRPALNALSRQMPPLLGVASALDQHVRQASLVQATDASWDGLFVQAVRAALRHGRPLVAVPLMHLGDDRVRAHFTMAHQVEAYRAADAVLALSRAEADALHALGVRGDRIHLISMGIDPAPPPSSAAALAFRQRYALDRPFVAYLGGNTHDKGAFALASAVARLAGQGLEVDLVCAGPQGDLLQAYVGSLPAAQRQTLASRLRILGIIDEGSKQALLAACSLLALPSQVDTFGIVILEAWAQGKPVIGARAGGLPDLIVEGETGQLVPFGDVPALAAAIARLLQDGALADRLGHNSQQLALVRYTWDATYQALLAIYARLACGDDPCVSSRVPF